MKLNIDKKLLVDIAVKLIQIDTRNASLCSDGPGESECVKYLAELYQKLGIDYTIHKLSSKQANIVAKIKGKGKGKTLLFNAHMDTVGTEGMKDPFSGKIENGRLYGRGSQDMKASLAAIIAAAKAIIDNKIELDGDLLIAAVSDEEYSSAGTMDLIKHYTADAAVITEPTDFSLVTAHRGFIWYEIETVGKAAHGSKYNVGIDANMHMGRFIAELDKLEQKLRKRRPDPLVGLPSLHAALIQGGTDISTYSGKCTLKVERRTVPGEKEVEITNEIQSIIDEISKNDSNFKATVKPFFQRPQFKVSHDSAIVKTAQKVLNNHFDTKCSYSGAPFWTDAALLSEAGTDCIILGPVGKGLHTTEEWVDVSSIKKLSYILANIALIYCKS
ncbi:MAG: ArgE/DapE family deacylase [Lentisphaerae bacterium]|nr:ArgE/DapE family deacylase [Lentisphaerota bacterium]MCP4102090.1 ArgE/DapE family deacylase [Lentisphaerota bacterium]